MVGHTNYKYGYIKINAPSYEKLAAKFYFIEIYCSG